MIVHGEAEWDAWYLDPRRFAGYANQKFTLDKAIEDFRNEFHYVLPREYRSASRQMRTTPLYSVLDQLNCHWGVVAGWERSLFFKPSRAFVDEPGFRFNSTKEVVAEEVRQLVNGVGLMEVSGFNRYEISGPGARNFLDTMICGNMPARIGDVRLCYLLSEAGNILSEATIAWLAEDAFWYGSAAASQMHDRDWLNCYKPKDVEVLEMTESRTTLVLAGPESRHLLNALLTGCSISAEVFPWMAVRKIMIGQVRLVAMSVSFSGELAYELHVENSSLCQVWQALVSAGEKFGFVHFGLYATESMRIEKGCLAWKSDLIREYNPIETGLGRFVKLDKPYFVGKQGLIRQLEYQTKRKLVSISVDCDHACAHSGTPVYFKDPLIGSVTSGQYGHRTGINFALAFVNPGHSDIGRLVELEILGDQYPGVIIDPCQYGRLNRRVRA